VRPGFAHTGLADIHSNTNAGRLPDGRVYLLHNPVIGPTERDPLVLSLSSDGFAFDQAYGPRRPGAVKRP
jgi:hypothetical protein